MVSVLAQQKAWGKPKFHVCRDFEGLRTALGEGLIDAFLWEHFTTRPYEAKKQLSIVGDVPTPWGCFCAVMAWPPRIDVASAQHALDSLLQNGERFQNDTDGTAINKICTLSGMARDEASTWLEALRYGRPGDAMSQPDLALAQSTLVKAEVISAPSVGAVGEYCTSRVR